MEKLTKKEVNIMINTALEEGIDFFDHADIYGGGKSEEVFANAISMPPSIREKMFLQSKCGIAQLVMIFLRSISLRPWTAP